MARVALITTGKTELSGLPTALQRLFPDHEFLAIPKIAPDRPFNGFTTARLPSPGGRTVLTALVEAMAAAAYPGRRGKKDDPKADFVLLLDDLELANQDQASVVVQEVRRAVEEHLDRLPARRPSLVPRVREALQMRASFHLAVPMIESWFFADPGGLARSGVPASRLPPIVADGDPEQLEVLDQAYLADDCTSCTAWQALTGRKQHKNRPAWHPDRPIERERHPKAYLSWLQRDPTEKNCTAYHEIPQGRDALAGLDWTACLQQEHHCRYLRSLLVDLADALEEELPDEAEGDVAPETSRHHLPQNPLLRNI